MENKGAMRSTVDPATQTQAQSGQAGRTLAHGGCMSRLEMLLAVLRLVIVVEAGNRPVKQSFQRAATRGQARGERGMKSEGKGGPRQRAVSWPTTKSIITTAGLQLLQLARHHRPATVHYHTTETTAVTILQLLLQLSLLLDATVPARQTGNGASESLVGRSPIVALFSCAAARLHYSYQVAGTELQLSVA